MNYIAEIRAFYDWVESNPSISASCISLWHGLLYQANKTGWKPEFSVAISTLELRTGLKRGAIYKARNMLKQCGAIDFKERAGSQSAIYRVNSLCLFNEHNSDTTVNTIASQTDTQQRHNREPLLNETIRNETNNNPLNPPSVDGGNKQPPKSSQAEQTKAELRAIRDKYVFGAELDKALNDWLKYKHERRQNYKPTGLRSLLTQIHNKLKEFSEEQVILAITESMACNYQGIIWDKAKQNSISPYNDGHKETVNERNNRLLDEFFFKG